MSSLTATQILIEPEISRGLLRTLLTTHALAFLPVMQSGLTNGQEFILSVVLLGSYCWQRYRLRHRRFGIRYHQQRWNLYRQGSEPDTRIEVSLSSQVVVTRWFVVLYFYVPGSRWRQTPVVITTDSVPLTTFRHLCVLLKWGL